LNPLNPSKLFAAIGAWIDEKLIGMEDLLNSAFPFPELNDV
jgi:hypothetical protein